MAFRYVPNLRWKRGEKNALKDLSPQGKKDVVPLFLLGSDQFKSKKATNNSVEIPAPSHFAKQIAECWGLSEFYLDVSSIQDVQANHHPLIDIASECRKEKLKLIPVVRTGSTKPYLQAAKQVVSADKRGVCLAITLQEISKMPNWINSWPFPPEETDLIIDYLNQAKEVLAFDQILAPAFHGLHVGNRWRSVTIVGTSIPDNFTGLDQGLYNIPRHQKAIWKLLSAAGLPYRLDYGDYATISVTAPSPGIKWGYPITAKYTLRDEFLICRGVRTTGLGAEDLAPQLIKHACSIVTCTNRGALSQCWADEEINRIANNTTPPRNLEHWVRIGINRHIELVKSALP